MEQCSICLESLDDGGVVALACNHRFHAACLTEMAGAVRGQEAARGAALAAVYSYINGEKAAKVSS